MKYPSLHRPRPSGRDRASHVPPRAGSLIPDSPPRSPSRAKSWRGNGRISLENGDRRVLDVKVGDRVPVRQVLPHEVKIAGRAVSRHREEDIMGVIEA